MRREQLLDAARLRADLADHVLRALREAATRRSSPSGNRPRMNSLFFLRELVGLGVGQAGEVAAERLPEVARAVGLERRQQLGEHLVAEAARGASR